MSWQKFSFKQKLLFQGIYNVPAVRSINMYGGWYSVLWFVSVIAVGGSYE
jgi:hypothetical protein